MFLIHYPIHYSYTGEILEGIAMYGIMYEKYIDKPSPIEVYKIGYTVPHRDDVK